MANAVSCTVVPGKETLITALVNPDAVCKLHFDPQDNERYLQLYADSEGIIRFHIHPQGPFDGPFEFMLKSEEGTSYQISLRSAHEPSKEHPFHVPIEASGQGAHVRPALTVQEAESLSNNELFKRGYSPRPKLQGNGGTLDAWLRSVTTKYTWVNSKTVSRPDRGRGYATRNDKSNNTSEVTRSQNLSNWSGFELNAPEGSVSAVIGAWKVPSVTEFGWFGKSSSSIWVGIDGDKYTDPLAAGDLVQAGTEQDVSGSLFGSVPIKFHSYYGWTEFLPQQQTSQIIPNFAVHPGDQIFVEVSILGFDEMPDPAGDRARFILRNDTTNKIAQVVTPRGTTNIVASEAVWIVERPTLVATKTLFPLSNYGTVTITSAQAGIGSNTEGGPNWFNYTLGQDADDDIYNTIQITMINSAGTANLSTVAEVDESTMTFTWEGTN
jgi:Peptidase A4 family